MRLCEIPGHPDYDQAEGIEVLVNPEDVCWVKMIVRPGSYQGEMVRNGSAVGMRNGSTLYCSLSPQEVKRILLGEGS